MTIIAADTLGTYLAVASDAYVGGKFVSDVIAPVAMFDPAIIIGGLTFAVLAGVSLSDVAAFVAPEPTAIPLPWPGLLLLGALAALRWRRG
ncbi:hypothetical protein [Dinoroseobacter sp. S375]|uniref:hypothetical protein n=1 Tax=Dinoroseobacter sp. S375 TaxID=3415136 RepID=UPI003C7ACECC